MSCSTKEGLRGRKGHTGRDEEEKEDIQEGEGRKEEEGRRAGVGKVVVLRVTRVSSSREPNLAESCQGSACVSYSVLHILNTCPAILRLPHTHH